MSIFEDHQTFFTTAGFFLTLFSLFFGFYQGIRRWEMTRLRDSIIFDLLKECKVALHLARDADARCPQSLKQQVTCIHSRLLGYITIIKNLNEHDLDKLVECKSIDDNDKAEIVRADPMRFSMTKK